MLVTFILGIVAGYGASFADQHVQNILTRLLPNDTPLEPVELRALSLAACILVAALLAWIIAEPYAVPLALGVLLGVLGPRLKGMARSARAPDYDS